MALPGMEHLAHPWARQAARGLTLSFEHDPEAHENALFAVRPEHRERPWATHHGVLQWADQQSHHLQPGEIAWVHNTSGMAQKDPTTKVSEEHGGGRGLAADMMRSAHYFDMGQDTLPLHSPSRTSDGDRFADTVMPELKPSSHDGGGFKAKWASRPQHPYEIEGREKEQANLKALRQVAARRKGKVPMKPPNPEAGRLF